MTFKVKRLKLIIAENFKYTDKYTQNKSIDQCIKYQDFKYFSFKYKKDIKYKICADSHFVKNHSCFI